MGVTGNASVFTLAQYGDYETFLKKWNVKYLKTTSEVGSSLLQHAIVGRNFEIALFLLEQNIDVNVTNINGQTSLHLICIYPNIEVAEKILKNGGNIYSRDKFGNNPMWTAVFNSKGNYYEMIKLLIKFKPDVVGKNKAGRSPLDFAMQVGDEKLINILQLQNYLY